MCVCVCVCVCVRQVHNIRITFSIESSFLMVRHVTITFFLLKKNQIDDTSWPENVENIQIFCSSLPLLVPAIKETLLPNISSLFMMS